MPALGADMEMGRLVQWCVPAGTHVKPGDVVAVVETQKGAIDVEIFLDGVLEDLVPLGTELPVGGVLAHVRGQEEAPGAVAKEPVPPATRVRASPAARRRAQELGVDLAALAGSGPDGVIALADVERATQLRPPPAAQPAPAGFDPAQMSAAIATAMGRSKREIPHYYLTQAIDFGAAQQWLTAYNEQRAPAERLLAAVLFLKATALALRQVPQLNGFWRDGAAQLAPSVHPGWAISLRGGGLVAPALHDADRASLPALMVALRDLVQRARNGRLRSSELSDPTVTVTSLGERGADSVLGVIYPPQLALIGFGRIVTRPWVADGQLVVRPVVQASVAADHRASDGHLGARFLELLDAGLQDPAALARSTT
ncbi:dihydrolipoamide acetyltransferase family protein [Variovorax sp. YR216]|uniref:dihydrolipoamide acetyltransferase family protein n=1 Tax=Variovorax sp. YR216 TaxID=1882828 RepID=UPI00210F1951|nr:dihydrolipoamide acetyltransferase family protein [Variovorax sp. YR216]